MSALSFMRTSRRLGSETKHYVVFPGRCGQRCAALNGIAEDSFAIPLVPWNRSRTPWTLRKQIASWRTQARKLLSTNVDRALGDLVERWQIDVIHTNSVVIDTAARFAEHYGVPHVWHIRERIGQDGFMWFSQPDEEVAAIITGRSASVPVISKYVREFFIRHGVGDKTRLVYDGMDAEYFAQPEAVQRGMMLRREWRIPENAPVVGMVGGLATTVKRHDVFLQSAQRVLKAVPDAWFLIVGAMPLSGVLLRRPTDRYANRIKSMIASLGLSNRVVFAGFNEDMPAIWRVMNVYVHTCEVEGFSRAILEAMATGVPIIAADSGGNPEAIRDGETGILFGKGDVESCSEAIIHLLNESDSALDYATAAHQDVRRRFCPAMHHNALIRILSEAKGQAVSDDVDSVIPMGEHIMRSCN